MKKRHTHRSAILQAGICLLAAVLLYAPGAAAAFSGHKGESCCAAGQCPADARHHSKLPAGPGSAAKCGHDLAKMAACTMDCCQSPERFTGAPMAFLLPPPANAFVAPSLSPFLKDGKSREIPRAIAPASPPPRWIDPAL